MDPRIAAAQGNMRPFHCQTYQAFGMVAVSARDSSYLKIIEVNHGKNAVWRSALVYRY